MEELTCLAWVASVLQGHKAGFNFASAARAAFDASNRLEDDEPAVLGASGIAFEVADAPPLEP